MTTANKAAAVDGGIRRPFQIGRFWPAATEPQCWTTKGTMNAFAIIIIAAGLVLNVAGQSATTNAAGAARLQLYVRTYQTDTNSFFSSLRAQMRAKHEQGDLEVLTDYFKQKGIAVSPPFAYFYKPRTGWLIIRATEQDHKKIRALLPEPQLPKSFSLSPTNGLSQ
jgi:hypothetical protein